MALRTPLTLAARRATSTAPTTYTFPAYSSQWWRGNATVAPVAQKTGADGQGTANVFMNMGGPSKTDEVHGFLSRLFVRVTSEAYRTA
jgi:ferrochelatase